MKRGFLWLILGILFIPAFSLMLRPGIFTMHDPHLFRIFEFNRCFVDAQIPCRWAPDSGKGYGEPLFNFYAQAPYWLTQKFILIGFSILDSAKIVYILSLALSGMTMFMLARRYWGPLGGLISAVFYVYAPYRAVDVWVRGALPEALAFILYPLIILFLDQYLESGKRTSLLGFSLTLSLLINTHNLSFLMFLPFLGIYWLFKSWSMKKLFTFWPFLLAGIFSLLLSAFYLLPVIFESDLVTLGEMVKGYYDYHIHFTTLRELFVDRFWGYGASLWQKKYLSVSIGHLHWIIPLLILFIVIIKKKIFSPYTKYYLLSTFLGLLALFLTHGKSSFIWNLVKPMEYIQFPWRFLTIAVFFLSLASGNIANVLKNRNHLNLLITLVIVINFSFFRPDIWRDHTDAQTFSGPLWDEARSSSLTDFWPAGSPPPSDFAPDHPLISLGEGTTTTLSRQSGGSAYLINVSSASARVKFPQVYFPGWIARNADKNIPVSVDTETGRITLSLPQGQHLINLKFINTPIRGIGNLVSLLTLLSLPLWFLKKRPI